MENVKKKKLRKPLIVLFAVIVLILWSYFGRFFLFRTTIIEKTSFTSDEIAIIASELSIPSDEIQITKMTYAHAKDSSFCIYIDSNSKTILDPNYQYEATQYSYVGNNTRANAEVYRSKQKPNYSCYVTMDNKLFYFTILDYNQSLMDIMEQK